MKKVSLGIVLVIMAVFLNVQQGIGHAAAIQFKDLTSSSSTYGSAYTDVSYLIQKGVINDYKIGGSYYFKPGSPVTKAQAAITLVKALGIKPSAIKKPYFKDVTASNSAFGYIQKAKELGILTGNSNGLFSPNSSLTRSQAATAVVKTFKLSLPKNVPNGFSDVTSGKSNYTNINALYFDGITSGTSGKYLPNNTINRADFSVFVARGMVFSKRVNPKIASEYITASYLNVRKSPSASGSVEGLLSQGTKVTVYTGGTSTWCKINYNGKWGYVSKKFVSTKPLSPQSSSPNPTTTQTNPTCSTSSSGTHIASVSTTCPPTGTPTSYTGGATDSSLPLANKIIVIDPGHGGSDPGTSSNGVDEKTVTLAVGLDVQSKLKALGAKVYMTRTTDTFPTLAERVALSNQVKPNLFLSIHCNSADASANGTETYYDTAFNPFPTQSQVLGNDIEQGIVAATGSHNRGAREDTTLYDTGLYVLSNNNFPAVLTELGFLTNSSERAMLTSPTVQQKYAMGITNGILAYLSLQS